MGKKFQDYSGIQGFVAEFRNSASKFLIISCGVFDLISVYLRTIDHLNLKLLIFLGILQVLRFDFQKLRILEILNFHPCSLGRMVHCIILRGHMIISKSLNFFFLKIVLSQKTVQTLMKCHTLSKQRITLLYTGL